MGDFVGSLLVTIIGGVAVVALVGIGSIVKRRSDRKAAVDHDLQVRSEFLNGLADYRDRGNTANEVIIRDLNRSDEYFRGNKDPYENGDWHRAAYKDLYPHGIEVFDSMPLQVIWDESREYWRPAVASKDRSGLVTASPVGLIPFRRISQFDWEGDGYYWIPHIFVRYRRFPRSPYDQIKLYEAHEGVDDTFYVELDGPTIWDNRCQWILDRFKQSVRRWFRLRA